MFKALYDFLAIKSHSKLMQEELGKRVDFMFNSTITVYQKQTDDTWTRTVLNGVQWKEKFDKTNSDGKISVANYISITIIEPSCDLIELKPFSDEDCIVFGNVNFNVTTERGSRVSDLLKLYEGGIIQSVSDNRNKEHLRNVKVVIA